MALRDEGRPPGPSVLQTCVGDLQTQISGLLSPKSYVLKMKWRRYMPKTLIRGTANDNGLQLYISCISKSEEKVAVTEEVALSL